MEAKEKAIKKIEDVILNSEKSYSDLMVDLENKIDDWRDELRKINYINIFELNDEQRNRKIYLEEIIRYSESKITKHKYNIYMSKYK